MTLFEYLSVFNIPKREFAERIGVSESGLYKIINGTREPKLLTAIKIYKLTSGYVDYSDLLVDPSEADIDISDSDML